MQQKNNGFPGAIAGIDGARLNRISDLVRDGLPAVGGDSGVAFFHKLLRTTPGYVLEPLLNVYVDGVSLRQLARKAGINPGVFSRKIKKLLEAAKPYFLGVLAAGLIEQGACGFVLDPRRGRPVAGGGWAVPDGPEVCYDNAPCAEDLVTFIVEHRDVLFGTDVFLGGWVLRAGSPEWALALTRLSPTEAAAREAARVRGAASIVDVRAGRPLGASRRAA
jgi:hypothetical protein